MVQPLQAVSTASYRTGGPTSTISAPQACFKHRQCYTANTVHSPLCRPCVAGFVAFFIAQSLKVLTHWYSEGRWDFTRVIGSGGMPSSHTACVSLQWPAVCIVHAQDRTEMRCTGQQSSWYVGCCPHNCTWNHLRDRHWHICHRLSIIPCSKPSCQMPCQLPCQCCSYASHARHLQCLTCKTFISPHCWTQDRSQLCEYLAGGWLCIAGHV